jgi:hypothetical protein
MGREKVAGGWYSLERAVAYPPLFGWNASQLVLAPQNSAGRGK